MGQKLEAIVYPTNPGESTASSSIQRKLPMKKSQNTGTRERGSGSPRPDYLKSLRSITPTQCSGEVTDLKPSLQAGC